VQLLPRGADVACHIIKKKYFFKILKILFLKLKKYENNFKNHKKTIKIKKFGKKK